MSDFSLLARLPFVRASTHHQHVFALQYLCNLPFAEVLHPTKNHKFPGTMVVSLTREHLPLLVGAPPQIVPYEKTHLFPWWEKHLRVVPPIPAHWRPPVARSTTGVLKKEGGRSLPLTPNPALPPITSWTYGPGYQPLDPLDVAPSQLRVAEWSG